MKIRVQDQILTVSFEAYTALKKENKDLEVISYKNHVEETLEESYGDKILECYNLCMKSKIMLQFLPSPDTANYADLGSATELKEHLDRVHDMLKSWTGFECNE